MNQGPILFSIVVPIYNVKQFLAQCVDSILNQTYKIFELILVDDGSTDGSAQMCDQYEKKDNRIRVIHKDNGGLVSARKAGAAIATGEYSICVDGDDWIDAEYLETVSRVIEEYNPDVICFDYYEAHQNALIARNNRYRCGYYSKEDIQNEVFPELIRNRRGGAFPPSIWSKVYKTALYRPVQLSVSDRIKIAEDAACIIPCILNAESMYILDKALYYYRQNNASMTKVKKAFAWTGPDVVEIHLRKYTNNMPDIFDEQIYRRTVCALFNVVKTQFYSKEPFFATRNRIIKKLQNPIYNAAIINCHFDSFSPVGIFHFFIRHRLLFPFYILSLIK